MIDSFVSELECGTIPNMANLRAAVEVTAGLVPTQPVPELTRQWFILSDEYHEAVEKTKNQLEPAEGQTYPIDYVGRLLADRQGQAMAYAQLLMLQPDQYNFVQTTWVWY